MPPAFQIEIITPNESFFTGTVSSMIAPGTNGFFGVLAHHAPLVGRTDGGRLTVRRPEEGDQTFVIGVGIIEVLKNRVTILTKEAKHDQADS